MENKDKMFLDEELFDKNEIIFDEELSREYEKKYCEFVKDLPMSETYIFIGVYRFGTHKIFLDSSGDPARKHIFIEKNPNILVSVEEEVAKVDFLSEYFLGKDFYIDFGDTSCDENILSIFEVFEDEKDDQELIEIDDEFGEEGFDFEFGTDEFGVLDGEFDSDIENLDESDDLDESDEILYN